MLVYPNASLRRTFDRWHCHRHGYNSLLNYKLKLNLAFNSTFKYLSILQT